MLVYNNRIKFQVPNICYYNFTSGSAAIPDCINSCMGLQTVWQLYFFNLFYNLHGFLSHVVTVVLTNAGFESNSNFIGKN